MLDTNLPVTVNIIVTPETCYRGSAQTREGKFFEFELLFNEVEFEAIPLQLTTPKQYNERRYIASECIKNVIKNAVAAKYHQDVVCDKFELRNPPYFELQKNTTEETVVQISNEDKIKAFDIINDKLVDFNALRAGLGSNNPYAKYCEWMTQNNYGKEMFLTEEEFNFLNKTMNLL